MTFEVFGELKIRQSGGALSEVFGKWLFQRNAVLLGLFLLAAFSSVAQENQFQSWLESLVMVAQCICSTAGWHCAIIPSDQGCAWARPSSDAFRRSGSNLATEEIRGAEISGDECFK